MLLAHLGIRFMSEADIATSSVSLKKRPDLVLKEYVDILEEAVDEYVAGPDGGGDGDGTISVQLSEPEHQELMRQ